MPPTVTNRVFEVVLISAVHQTQNQERIFVIQLPVDLQTCPNIAGLLNYDSKHRFDAKNNATHKDKPFRKKSVLNGIYASVECVSRKHP